MPKHKRRLRAAFLFLGKTDVDLRHSFVSHQVLSGVSLKAAGALVGHTQVATTNRYANLTRDDLRDAADKFSNVIEFAQRKRA